MPEDDKILYRNSTNQIVNWVNSEEETIIVIVYKEDGYPVRASRLAPYQSIAIRSGCSLRQLD